MNENTTNNNKFTNWAVGIFTLILIALGTFALTLLVSINADNAVLKAQIGELSHVNRKIEVMQMQITSLQSEVILLKYEIQNRGE